MRVVVADDALLTREGIVRLLRDAGIEVVAQAENADELLAHVAREDPDVAVIDIRMPPTHTDEGLVAAQRIQAEYPDVGVLILSQYIDASHATRLLEEHPESAGYLLKERVFDVAVSSMRSDGSATARPSSTPRSFQPCSDGSAARIRSPS